MKPYERCLSIIERIVNEEGQLPKVSDLSSFADCAAGTASYAINDYIVQNGEGLLSIGAINEDKLNQARISVEKRSTGNV